MSSLFFWSGASRTQGLSFPKALKLLSYCVLGHISIVGVQEWQQSTLLVQCWDHLQLHMLVILLLQTRRCLEASTNYLSIYFSSEFGCANRHSCFVSYRFDSTYCCKQRMVERDWQKISGMASHCWSPSGHEPYQSPKLHCQVLNEDIRSFAWLRCLVLVSYRVVVC